MGGGKEKRKRSDSAPTRSAAAPVQPRRTLPSGREEKRREDHEKRRAAEDQPAASTEKLVTSMSGNTPKSGLKQGGADLGAGKKRTPRAKISPAGRILTWLGLATGPGSLEGRKRPAAGNGATSLSGGP